MPLPRTAARAAVAVAALAALTACTSRGPGISTPLWTTTVPSGSPFTFASPVQGRHSAVLELAGGATAVRVTTARLGDTLYRAGNPAGSSVHPTATIDGDTVTVTVAGGGGPGPSDVDITLNSAVAWTVRLDGGATTEDVDARSGGVRELDFGAGASRIDVTLPRPTGTIPVNLTGGASAFALHLPSGVPARVAFDGGGGTATLDGATQTGLSGGTTLTALDWTDATDRYTITCTAGVSALTLDRG